ncbi:MAG: hypothetical protein CVV25_01365 [Ignavibacteriae bacterium HGW-Ignavibacteriae-4]|nr:MAG: hypothetical protein CVV25_01365 [Ignavibacteriae bacterium HGW-Ignavibacteriae-4]
MKFNLKIIKSVLVLIISCLIFFIFSPIKLVKVNHETFFTEDYYYYMIEIYEQNQLYFENVNKNEISLNKVTPANVVKGTEYFLTFQDSIKVTVTTEKNDTSSYFPLDKYTNIRVRPYQSFTIMSSSSVYLLQDH